MFFGAVDVAQRMHEQVVHCLDVFREEAHDVQPFFGAAISFRDQLRCNRAFDRQRATRARGSWRSSRAHVADLGARNENAPAP
jgi:hypothetical protein